MCKCMYTFDMKSTSSSPELRQHSTFSKQQNSTSLSSTSVINTRVQWVHSTDSMIHAKIIIPYHKFIVHIHSSRPTKHAASVWAICRIVLCINWNGFACCRFSRNSAVYYERTTLTAQKYQTAQAENIKIVPFDGQKYKKKKTKTKSTSERDSRDLFFLYY